MPHLPYVRQPMAGIANFRDLGGYPAADGGMTRWGVFYRSARLSAATPGDLDALHRLGIRTVIDLRDPAEISLRPNAGLDDTRFAWRHLSLLAGLQLDAASFDVNPDEPPLMSTLYQLLVDHCQGQFCSLLDLLAQSVGQGSVLFHCTAGKDRTGLTAMFLQALCGVGEPDMIAHYQVSHTYILEMMPEDTTGSDPDNLRTLLAYLRDRWGGPVAFLRAAGVQEATLSTLRGSLLMPPA